VLDVLLKVRILVDTVGLLVWSVLALALGLSVCILLPGAAW